MVYLLLRLSADSNARTQGKSIGERFLRAAPESIFPVPGFPIMKLLISSGADPKATVDDSLEQISLIEFINKTLKRCYPEEA